MAILEDDDDTQRKGIVFVLFNVVGPDFEFGPKYRKAIWRGAHLVQCLPMRPAAAHFCHDDPRLQTFLSLLLLSLGPEYRRRFRVHNGT